MAPFAYETSNTELIRDLKLIEHPEGGYFVETVRSEETVPSPFVNTKPDDDAARNISTTIYYLLTPDRNDNYVHMNKSATMHVLHQGRAEYLLIHPKKASESRPRIERVIMGPNASKGEVRQLYVPTNVWKKSRLLTSDLEEVKEERVDKERVGCLITEVVVPGFDWRDHKWMTVADLDEVFEGNKDDEIRKELEGHVHAN